METEDKITQQFDDFLVGIDNLDDDDMKLYFSAAVDVLTSEQNTAKLLRLAIQCVEKCALSPPAFRGTSMDTTNEPNVILLLGSVISRCHDRAVKLVASQTIARLAKTIATSTDVDLIARRVDSTPELVKMLTKIKEANSSDNLIIRSMNDAKDSLLKAASEPSSAQADNGTTMADVECDTDKVTEGGAVDNNDTSVADIITGLSQEEAEALLVLLEKAPPRRWGQHRVALEGFFRLRATYPQDIQSHIGVTANVVHCLMKVSGFFCSDRHFISDRNYAKIIETVTTVSDASFHASALSILRAKFKKPPQSSSAVNTNSAAAGASAGRTVVFGSRHDGEEQREEEEERDSIMPLKKARVDSDHIDRNDHDAHSGMGNITAVGSRMSSRSDGGVQVVVADFKKNITDVEEGEEREEDTAEDDGGTRIQQQQQPPQRRSRLFSNESKIQHSSNPNVDHDFSNGKSNDKAHRHTEHDDHAQQQQQQQHLNDRSKEPQHSTRSAQSQHDEATSFLLIKNLPTDVLLVELLELLRRYSECDYLQASDIVIPPPKRKLPGQGSANPAESETHAYVNFQHIKDARLAKSALSGKSFGGRVMSVSYSVGRPTNSVWIGAINPRLLKAADIERCMRQFGPLVRLDYRERKESASDAYAFAVFEDVSYAIKAVKALGSDARIDGVPVRIGYSSSSASSGSVPGPSGAGHSSVPPHQSHAYVVSGVQNPNLSGGSRQRIYPGPDMDRGGGGRDVYPPISPRDDFTDSRGPDPRNFRQAPPLHHTSYDKERSAQSDYGRIGSGSGVTFPAPNRGGAGGGQRQYSDGSVGVYNDRPPLYHNNPHYRSSSPPAYSSQESLGKGDGWHRERRNDFGDPFPNVKPSRHSMMPPEGYRESPQSSHRFVDHHRDDRSDTYMMMGGGSGGGGRYGPSVNQNPPVYSSQPHTHQGHQGVRSRGAHIAHIGGRGDPYF